MSLLTLFSASFLRKEPVPFELLCRLGSKGVRQFGVYSIVR